MTSKVEIGLDTLGDRTEGSDGKPLPPLPPGGPVSSPGDASFIINNTRNCHGFYGASSMGRLPTELALTEQTRMFKAIGRQRG